MSKFVLGPLALALGVSFTVFAEELPLDLEPALAAMTQEEFKEISELMRKLGEIQRQDLFVPVARLQLHYMLRLADEVAETDQDQSRSKLRFARGVAYNIASFPWPGWGDLGDISEERRELGRSAARVGLRLAEQIGEVTSNILWINGAHLLSAREYEDAARTFAQAKERDQSEIGGLMHQAWIELTKVLQNPNPNTEKAFESAFSALNGSDHKHAKFFADQLVTAREIFAVP